MLRYVGLILVFFLVPRPIVAQEYGNAVRALLDALQTGNFHQVEPWLSPHFNISSAGGEQSRALFRQLVEARARVPESMVLDSIRSEGSKTTMFVTARYETGPRQIAMVADTSARFIDVGLFSVERTAPQTVRADNMGAAVTNDATVLLAPIGGARSVVDGEYREALLRLYERDQRYRGQLVQSSLPDTLREQLSRRQAILDSVNVMALDSLVGDRGWPRRNDVGDDAATAAFMILQHAAPTHQRRYLDELRTLAAAGEISLAMVALLEDRLDIYDGKPQTFGTQVRVDPRTGRLEPYPLKDPEGVDARRASVGLPPLDAYLRLLEQRRQGG